MNTSWACRLRLKVTIIKVERKNETTVSIMGIDLNVLKTEKLSLHYLNIQGFFVTKYLQVMKDRNGNIVAIEHIILRIMKKKLHLTILAKST